MPSNLVANNNIRLISRSSPKAVFNLFSPILNPKVTNKNNLINSHLPEKFDSYLARAYTDSSFLIKSLKTAFTSNRGTFYTSKN